VRSEGRTSAQSSRPAAGHRDARVSGRGVASGRSDASERGLLSWRGASGQARRGEPATITVEERRGGDLWETAKCQSGRRQGLEASTFCHVSYTEPRLKAL
jgi:hypothetical protein